jgi:fumarate reductase flavoprotein subunit
LQGGGFAVGEDGKRFVNEDSSYMTGELTDAIIRQIAAQKARHVWVVVNDSSFLKHALQVHPVAVAKGDTIEALARAAGLDPAALRATVERFNRFCAKKKDADFGRQENLIPLLKGPFYAAKVHPAVIFTTGGLKIDARARVLELNGVGQPGDPGHPLPGLFAAGQVAEWCAVGGWTVSGAFTMGRIAGREAAASQAV